MPTGNCGPMTWPRSSTRQGLDSYYLFHPTRADLLRRLGRTTEAAAAYATARALTTNPVDQAFLDTQRAGSIRTGKV